MKEKIKIIGKRFGRLTALGRVFSIHYKKPTYRCLCDCGKEVNIIKTSLTRGLTRSCGCLHIETTKKLWSNEYFRKKITSSLPYMVGGEPLAEFKEMCRIRQTGKKHTLEYRLKMSKRMMGSGSNGWKGGVTEKNKKIRSSLGIKLWRENVFKRDNYTCMNCGVIGNKLNAHHIKPFSLYPDLRFDVDNGMTLCVPCHKQTDSYGRKKVA